MTYSKLSEPDRKKNEHYISSVRKHLGEEHKRWSESLFKLLTLSNTGGIVVVASLLSSVKEFRESICLRLILTFFVIGLIGNLFSIGYEFFDAKRDLSSWDTGKIRYQKDEINVHELYSQHMKISTVTPVAQLVIWSPAICFLAGCVTGLVFLWC